MLFRRNQLLSAALNKISCIHCHMLTYGYVFFSFFSWFDDSPRGSRSFLGGFCITLTHTTLGRTPLDEGSVLAEAST